MSARIDLTGRRFGRLTVLGHSHDVPRPGRQGPRIYWRLSCDCGNESVAWGYDLRKGRTTSCGCARRDRRPPAPCVTCGVQSGRRSRGLCDTCYGRVCVDGDRLAYPRATWPGALLVDEFDRLVEAGTTPDSAAAQLGVRLASVKRARLRLAERRVSA